MTAEQIRERVRTMECVGEKLSSRHRMIYELLTELFRVFRIPPQDATIAMQALLADLTTLTAPDETN